MGTVLKFKKKKRSYTRLYKLTPKEDKVYKYHLIELNTKPIDFARFQPTTIKKEKKYEVFFCYWIEYHKKNREFLTTDEILECGRLFFSIRDDDSIKGDDKFKVLYYRVNGIRLIA